MDTVWIKSEHDAETPLQRENLKQLEVRFYSWSQGSVISFIILIAKL